MTYEKRRKKLKQAGLCVICRKPSVKNKTMCYSCAKKQGDYRKQRRINRFDKGLCTCCGKNSPMPDKKRCKECHDRRLEWMDTDIAKAYQISYKPRNLKLRIQRKRNAINQYGGKCFCCGESDIRFLTIDHIKENGAEHRREIAPDFSGKVPGGEHFYRWLAKNDWPSGLQTACYNCNIAKHWNNGICPHKDVRHGV